MRTAVIVRSGRDDSSFYIDLVAHVVGIINVFGEIESIVDAMDNDRLYFRTREAAEVVLTAAKIRGDVL